MTKSIETHEEIHKENSDIKHITPSPVKRPWIIGGIIILVLVAGATLLLGMAIGASLHANSTTNGISSGQYGGPMSARSRFQLGIHGTVTAISSSSITVQTSNGSSKTYTIDSTTTVRDRMGQDASLSDITIGTDVVIRNANSTSTIASLIIIFDTSASGSTSTSGSTQSY